MKIAIDIDGTVLTQGSPEKNYQDAEAIPEMVAYVNNLYDANHEIFFFTARHFKHFVYTEKVLKEAGFKYHGLVMNKISCDLYIDDKGFRLDNNLDQLTELIEALNEI